MTKEAYPALFHYIHKQLADVDFPCTKSDILDKAGDRMVFTDWTTQVPLKVFIEPVPQQHFSCAADLYCMMIAAM